MKKGSFGHYLLMRVLLSIPMVLILLTLVFVLLHAAPGDPVTATLGSRLPPDQIAARKDALGLNDPIYVQYVRYLGHALEGDFGHPVTDSRSVGQIIADTAPATLELVIAAMLVAVLVGISVGALAARLRDTAFDLGGRFFGILIYATPLFWSALLAQLYLSADLHWLPSSGRIGGFYVPDHITGFYTIDSLVTGNWPALWSTLSHLALPAITLGLLVGGVFVRLVRVNMLQSLRSDYIDAARARGISERSVVYRHAFKNALIPVITIMGLQFALLIGNATLSETVFSWPGMARALVHFIGARDYSAVQGIVTFIALAIVVLSLIIDVINALIDPRVRY